jgi:hypothetical protein
MFSLPLMTQSGQGWHIHHSSAQGPPYSVHKRPSAPLYLHGHSNILLHAFKAVCLRAHCFLYFYYLVNELPSSPATWLESAAGRLLLAHLGHAEALCELFSSLDYSRTRVEEVLVAQALHVIEAALA